MEPIQIVIDTNVLVSALRSKHGASAALLRRIEDPRFEVNVSTALLLEYEAKLKETMVVLGLKEFWKADRFLDALARMANKRSIYFSFAAEQLHMKDAFVVDLAIASSARFVISYNLRHLEILRRFGRTPITPGEFLRWMEVAG